MKHLGDITKISGYDAPVVDCVIFGAPCQDLSVAGKRAGMKHSNLGDEEATRSGLFMEAVRIIKEMRTKDENERRCSAEFIRPRFAVYENVPGAFSSNKGEDFKIVLEELAKVIDKDAVIPMPPKGKWTNSGSIVGDGWSIAWRVLDGQFWGCTYVDDDGVPIRLGTPQRRKRIALVADFGGECASEVLFERKGLRGNSSQSGSEGQGTTSDTEGGSLADDSKGEAICYGISSFDSNGMKSDNPKSGIYVADTSRTLDLNGGNPACNQGGIAVVEPTSAYTLKIRSGCEGGGKGALVQEERSATLSTNNDQYLFAPVVIEPISLEPGVASREGGHIYEGVSGTLRANAGDNQMAVAYAIENHPADSRVCIDDSGKVQTLTGRMGTGGGNVPMVLEAVGIDCYNQAVTGDKSACLRAIKCDTDHVPCVAIDRAFFNQEKNALYDPQVYDDGTVPTLVAKGPSAVAYYSKPQYIVRRLTPMECERLQGYPDLWTDIGDFIDSKGKKKTSSDAVRYKALGNSICLPPWKWVLKRLCSHYERDATMASLFDGIGGFPCLWEQINGKGTALWASEIEEFPVAVTKVRVG